MNYASFGKRFLPLIIDGFVIGFNCHVQFNPQTRLFILNDMGSSHGTFAMNGSRLTQGQTVALKSGERFYLRTQNIMFETR